MGFIRSTPLLVLAMIDYQAIQGAGSGSAVVTVQAELDPAVLTQLKLHNVAADVFSVKARLIKGIDGTVVSGVTAVVLTKDSRRNWRGQITVPLTTAAGGYFVEVYTDGTAAVDLNGDGVAEITTAKIEPCRVPLRIIAA